MIRWPLSAFVICCVATLGASGCGAAEDPGGGGTAGADEGGFPVVDSNLGGGRVDGGLPEFPTVAIEPDAETLGAGPELDVSGGNDLAEAGPDDGGVVVAEPEITGAEPVPDVPIAGVEPEPEVVGGDVGALDASTPAEVIEGPEVIDAPDDAAAEETDSGPVEPQCLVALDCAVGQPLPAPCHHWVCDPVDGCQQEPDPPGTSCSTDACKAAQVCSGGSCVAGVGIVCGDGDSCTQDGCHSVTGCSYLPIPGCCDPDCNFKSCGTDGCGGTCGECEEGSTCQVPGVCVTCAIQCGGKDCGPDGCGGSCGTCPDPQECGATGLCEGCLPDCTGKVCGSDGCEGSCGTCQDGWACDDVGQCFCDATCVGKVCGSDGCTGSCGVCTSSETCSPGGACLVPSDEFGEGCLKPFPIAGDLPYFIGSSTQGLSNDAWTEAPCGQALAGLGGDSGDQVYGFTPETTGFYTLALAAQFDGALIVYTDCADPVGSCVAAAHEPEGDEHTGVWLEAGVLVFIAVDGAANDNNDSGPYTLALDYVDTGGCMPDCSGKKCGNNGCGTSCGQCAFDQICGGGGKCISGFGGDACDGPYIIQSFPFVAVANAAGNGDDYAFGEGACDGVAAAHGDGVADQAYELTAQTNGNFTFAVEGEGDPVVSVVWSCEDTDGLCIGAAATGDVLTRFFPVGTTVHVIVDAPGAYTLTVGHYDNPACASQCEEAQCGPDSCGGECGSCGPGPTCVGGLCASETQGSTCETPWVIGTTPFDALHTTELATPDYDYPPGACAGEPDGFGAAAPEHVYAFTPLASGTYIALVDASFDSGLYVVTDCSAVGSSCLGALNATTGIETLTVELEEGVTTYFIIDDASLGGPEPGPYSFELVGPY